MTKIEKVVVKYFFHKKFLFGGFILWAKVTCTLSNLRNVDLSIIKKVIQGKQTLSQSKIVNLVVFGQKLLFIIVQSYFLLFGYFYIIGGNI